jgi:hypothetical protein
MRRRIAASAGLAALLLIWNARDRARPWATRVEAESAMCAASLGLVLPSGALASGGKRRVRSMDGLAEWHTSATTERATIFRRLYDIERTVSYSHVPPAMRRRLEAAGRSPADFESQVSVVVQSRVLPSESVAFNQVRAQRFVGAPRPHDTGAGGSLDAAAAALHCQLPGASDFCDPHNRTLADPRIGYLTNGAAVGFANMGRLTALHGVVATARFVHPLALHADDVLGMVLLCHEWFGRARTQYGAAAQRWRLAGAPAHAAACTGTTLSRPVGGTLPCCLRVRPRDWPLILWRRGPRSRRSRADGKTQCAGDRVRFAHLGGLGLAN